MKKLVPLLAFAALLLGGCKGESSRSDVSSSDETSTVTSDVTSSVTTSEKEEEGELTISPNWPNQAIRNYAALFDIVDTVPTVHLEREIHHGVVDWGYEFYYLKIITSTDEDLLDIGIAFEDASYDLTLDEGYLYAESPHSEIQLFAYFYEEDEIDVDRIEIMLFIDEVDEDYFLDELEAHESWPTAAIASYVTLMGSDSVIPALPNVTESYTLYIEGDDFFPDPFFFVFVPGDERTLEYKAILENDGFDLELYDPDDFYDYYFAYKDAENLELEFGFYEAGDGFPAGMHIFITVYQEIEGPENPDNAFSFDFSSKAQLTTETDDLGVWTSGAATMTIAKHDSTVYVGGDKSKGGYWHSPLRVYAWQEVTFDVGAGKTIDQIVVSTDTGKSPDGLAEGYFDETVIVRVEGSDVIIKPTTSTQKVTVEISEQVRFSSLIIYYN